MTAPQQQVIGLADLIGQVTTCFWHQHQLLYGGKGTPPLPLGGVIVNAGGTWAGKTYGWVQHLWLMALSATDALEITVASHSIPHLRGGAYGDAKKIWASSPLLQRAFPRRLWNQSERKWAHATTGATMHFDSFDMAKALGGKRDILFVNEANKIPFEVYQELATRTRQKVILDFNPANEFYAHDLYRQDAGAGRVRWLRSTFEHNDFCPPHKADEILSWKETNPMRWQVYGEGKTGRVDGLVFNWHTAPVPPTAKLVAYGLDFGYHPDPTALVAIYREVDKVWINELVYETNLSPSQLVAKVKRLTANEPAQIWADGQRNDLIRELSAAGLSVAGATKGSGSILLGIEVMKEWSLHLTPTSFNLADELSAYFWPKNDLGNPVPGNPVGKADHGIDAARYAIYMTLAKAKQAGAPMGYSSYKKAAF